MSKYLVSAALLACAASAMFITPAAVHASPLAHTGGQCTDLYGKSQSAWQTCAEDHGVECEKFGQGTLGSGYNCHYPDGSHDDCLKIDDVMGKVSGGCSYYGPVVEDPDGHDH